MTTRLQTTFRIDALLNAVAGVALIAGAGVLDGAAGLDGPAPIVAIGLVFLANAAFLRRVAHEPTGRAVIGSVVFDLAFAAACVAVALADPTGAHVAVRWVIAATGDLAAVFGIAKFLALRATAMPAVRA